MNRIASAAGLVMAAALLAPAAAFAQIEVETLDLTLMAMSAASGDYLFRGISQSRNRPAIQGAFKALHGSGLDLGFFAGIGARQEPDLPAVHMLDTRSIAWMTTAILAINLPPPTTISTMLRSHGRWPRPSTRSHGWAMRMCRPTSSASPARMCICRAVRLPPPGVQDI
ncbi:TorF family putative porin [Teichococcus vastitatis]|uniref:Uncharacterized protein n=1 Tax=Teichococcus vastitatis TaxID=2307076 RepID=A0ABS9W9A5_9PROT|nr:TorF family putative porin [Pseudoroseomonas vastitatis]MCI0755885.1 hypothetical protein [Pseudoroseomonas vastitatis]